MQILKLRPFLISQLMLLLASSRRPRAHVHIALQEVDFEEELRDMDDDTDDEPHGDEEELPMLSLSNKSTTTSRANRRASSSPGGLKYDARGDEKASLAAKSVKKNETSKPRSDRQRGIGRDADVDARLR